MGDTGRLTENQDHTSLSGRYQRPRRPYVVRNGSGVARKAGSRADDAVRGVKRGYHAWLEVHTLIVSKTSIQT